MVAVTTTSETVVGAGVWAGTCEGSGGSARQRLGAASAARGSQFSFMTICSGRAARRGLVERQGSRRADAGPVAAAEHPRADGLIPDLRTSDGGGRSPGLRVAGLKIGRAS